MTFLLFKYYNKNDTIFLRSWRTGNTQNKDDDGNNNNNNSVCYCLYKKNVARPAGCDSAVEC